MGDDDGKPITIVHRHVELGKAPAHPKSPAMGQVAVIRVRAPRDNREPAEHGVANIRVAARNEFNVRQVEPSLLEFGLQVFESSRAAQFLDGEDVRLQGDEVGANLPK